MSFFSLSLFIQSYIIFGEREDMEMFNEMYSNVMKYLKKGWGKRSNLFDLFTSSCFPVLFGCAKSIGDVIAQ